MGGIPVIPKKINRQTVNALKSILDELDIHNQRVTIDFTKEMIEVEDDDYSIDDLLEAAGTLSPERAKELYDEVKRSREEWD
jgi:hypothetical protein